MSIIQNKNKSTCYRSNIIYFLSAEINNSLRNGQNEFFNQRMHYINDYGLSGAICEVWKFIMPC